VVTAQVVQVMLEVVLLAQVALILLLAHQLLMLLVEEVDTQMIVELQPTELQIQEMVAQVSQDKLFLS
jgi:hypothetical protein